MKEQAVVINGTGVEVKSPSHVRFSDLIWYDPSVLKHTFITIGGAGGIGSWLCLALSRIGYKLHIWDPDTVDETNLGGQLYGPGSIGQVKSSATIELCKQLGAEQMLLGGNGLVGVDTKVFPVAISAFDNMKARKALFEGWQKSLTDVSFEGVPKIFIDGRMLAETGQVFFVTPDKIDLYKEHLFADGDVKEQPCSAKATSHCGMHIASLMTSGLLNFISNVVLKDDIRELPFKIEFELPLFNYDFKLN